MDVKHVNPFVESFGSVMPQLGFSEVGIGKLSKKAKEVKNTGVLVILGVVGDIRGNVVYAMEMDVAKKIATTMMMGMTVEELDEIAQSALSELANMLTAHAATAFADIGISIDISTPTLLIGDNMTAKLNSEQILCVQFLADDMQFEINISFEN
jgi:chemotaxis protein CheX